MVPKGFLTLKNSSKIVGTVKNNSGTLIFEYKGSDQLDRLISVIKDNY